MVKLLRICVLVLAANLVAGTAAFAAVTYTLINVKHGCGGQSNGSFDIQVTAVTGASTGLRFEVLIFGPPAVLVVSQDVMPTPGLPYIFSVSGLAAADYVVRVTQLGPNTTSLKGITIDDYTVVLDGVTPNTEPSCLSPDGTISVTGTPGLSYTWTGPGGATYLTEDLTGLVGGDYDLSYTDGTNTCTLATVHVDDPLPSEFLISSADPAICVGEDLVVDIDVTDVGYTYSVMEGVAVLASAPGDGDGISINVPGLAAGNHTLQVRASQGCPPVFNQAPDLDVVVDVNPTITLDFTNPEVCEGVTTAIITYSATTGGADQYSIDFDAAAEGDGFIDMVDVTLVASQIDIDVPSAAPIGTYNAMLTVTNSVTGCISASIPITIKVNANPVIVPGPDPSVCAGVTTANLSYAGAVGADQYSLDFDVAAEAQNFVDIGPLVLPATPIGIAVPALAAPGIYNVTLRVITAVTGCFTDYPVTVTVLANPTITLGPNPAVCYGTTSVNLTYTATTADEYTIDFDATAEGEGFVDVTPFTALVAGPSQILIAIPSPGPGIGDPGTYLANLTIRNSGTLCTTTIPIQVIINPNPTITPVSTALQVCRATTSVNLPFSAVTDGPDQYSLDFDNAAETALFADVTNGPLGVSPIVIVVPANAPVAIYNVMLSVRNSTTGCVSSSTAITIEVLTTPVVSIGAVPAVCSGVTATSIPYSVTTGTPNQYSIDYDAVANGQLFVDVGPLALPGVAVPVAVPAGATPGLYSGTLRIHDSGNGCFSDYPFTVLINPLPTITGVADPQVCLGAVATSLTYTATGNGANQFSIVYGPGAIADGFADVTNVAFASPAAIPIVIPVTATATTYTGDLTVRNSATGCVSVIEQFQITINPNPTLTPGANPSVCSGVTSADLTFAALVGGDQYSLDFDNAANTAGFIDVGATGPLTSPITIAVPALAAANTYNATLRVINSTTSCFTDYPITVTVVANPTITLGANPAVCSGTASADLTYTATTADEYRLDFDVAAEGVGFVDDVGFQALAGAPSQITIAVPVAGAAGTYNANLIIRSTLTTCTTTVAIQVTINPLPTITGVADPQVCLGAIATSLTYAATSNGANQFSIVYGAGAIADGFADVANIAFASPAAIPIVIPVTATATTYTGDLTVRNSATGCVSVVEPFQITINPNPTLTPGTNPSVCAGVTSADLTFAALVGGDQYSIDFDNTANTAGFIDVGATGPLTSPITIAVPALAAANTYNATLRVINSTTSCFTDYPITVTVVANPTITLGANPAVCLGTTTANLTYTATTADEFELIWGPAGNAAGFADLTPFAALPGAPSQIAITIPVTAGPATYDADLTIRIAATGCTTTIPVQITINPNPTITVPDTSVEICSGGTSVNLAYTATTDSPTQYNIDFDASANIALFVDVTNAALPATPIVIAVPAGAAPAIYGGSLTVRNANGCISSVTAITVEVRVNPTITIPDTSVEICSGATSVNLAYTATTDNPTQYSIDFDATANTALFVDVTNAALPATPIVIAVPAGATPSTYNGLLTVTNGFGCVSSTTAITVTIHPNPTITLGVTPEVCAMTTTANLTYTATTADEYTLDFNPAAEGAGFADVLVFTALAAAPSQIVVVVPAGAAPATYNATLAIRINATGCTTTMPVLVTINPNPTITLDFTDPEVCSGTTTVDITYSATTASPNRYSIDFDAAAEGELFADVVNAPLTPSLIAITVPATALAGTYNANLTVRSSGSGCVSFVTAITVTVNPNPTITLGPDPVVCRGTTTADLTYSATTGSPDQYTIDFDATAETAGFADVAVTALPLTPIPVPVFVAAAPGLYNATLRVINSTTGCFSDFPFSVTVNANPTIVMNTNPIVCFGSVAANLDYTSTTADEYTLDFDAVAEGEGFVDVTTFTALAAAPSQVVVVVPGAAAPATYNASFIIRIAATGCTTTIPIQVTVNPNPSITLDFNNPSTCLGTTSVNITYSSTTASPDEYSIDFDVTAEGQGFVDVVNAALPASPLTIVVPGTTLAGTYNANLTVSTNTTGCAGGVMPITITVLPNPTIALGASPLVCIGATTADLTYSATTASPDQYSIDFDATAEAAGFADIVITALPATPISMPVPAAAASGVYNATITVYNSIVGCTGTPTAFTVSIGIDVTLSAIAPVCINTNADIPYTPVLGSPNLYSFDFDAAAESAGFVDVVDAVLTVTSITVSVPANTAGVFNGSLTVSNSSSGCVSPAKPITITVGTTIALGANPAVCQGVTAANLTYTTTTGGPDQYSIDFDVTAEGQLFVDVVNTALTGSPIVLVVPAAALAGTYNANLTVINSVTGCTSLVLPITVDVKGNPTITLAPDPLVCGGAATANLAYTATTDSPDQYSIDFDATAEAAGFADVVATALPATPIALTVPGAAAFGVYNATITVYNTITGCTGTATAFTVTIGIDITPGVIAPVCLNTNAVIPYTPVVGSPDVYSIDFDAVAEAAGFVDVVDAALTVANITVIVPANVGGVFNGSLTVKNTATGCISSIKPITLTVGTTITLGPDPAICESVTSADLTYTATTGGPDLYSIDFDAAAEAAGFVDVIDVALTASPIVIVVPATAPAAIYNYTVTVSNSTTSCSSVLTSKTLAVNSQATANAGLDETICVGATYFLTGSSVGNAASTGAWTITSQPTGGDGVLSSSAQVADPTTISFTATVAGDYVLTLISDDPAGPCVPAQDDVTITITPIPVVTVGQTKTICGNDNVAYEILLSPLNFPAGTLLNWPDPDGGGPATAGVNVPVGPAGTIHINDRLTNNTLANISMVYQVTPSFGLCVGTQEDITVVVQPSPVLEAMQAKTICSGDVVNYEILLNPANTPAGTTFSWPDPDGAGSGTSQLNIVADPVGKIHITDTLYNGTAADIHIIYSIIATAPNGCRAIPRDIDVTVNPGAVVEAGAAQSICSTGTATLGGSSIGGLATAGTWTIFASPVGGDGSLSVTTATATPDVVTFTATVAGGYTLRLTTDDPAGSCVAVSEDVVITVRSSSDPACVGGIIGTGDCTTVVIIPKPTAATCSNSDGSIIFTIKPFVPAVLTTEVRIDIVGISPSNNTISRTVHNDSTFTNLPVGIYDYSIEYGDPACIKTGQVTIDRSGTVDVPVFSNLVDPVCFGIASGSVTIDVPGETGNPLEWSVDGVVWTPFIAGNTVTGMPAGSNIISVRRTAADACASGAVLTLANPAEIVTTLAPSNATCNNNDGSITVGPVTGGTGPYTFTLNGVSIALPADNILPGLAAGNQIFVVTDAVGCNATFIASVTFPGYVNHTVPVITHPDCAGGGTNGSISLQIIDAGSFEFGITTDPVLEPAAYNPTGGAIVTISNLPNETYAVWLKPSAGSQCATKIGDQIVAGIYPVSVQASNTSAVCFNNQAAVQITAMGGAPLLDYTYELTNTSDNSVVSGAITASQSLAPFTINGVDAGSYSLRILQDQSSINPSCSLPIGSAPVALVIDGPTALLDTLSVARKLSYPDLASGTANVVVAPSGKEPYEARLELVQPADPTQAFVQDWTAVVENTQTLKFEYKFRDLFAGLYELRLRDAFGCERAFDLTIGSDPTIMIPNIFTPNGDKVNDVFFIRNLPSDVAVVITNRWGKEVFKSNSYDNTWDGGETADGVYYYRINLPGQAITGWVEILRGQ